MRVYFRYCSKTKSRLIPSTNGIPCSFTITHAPPDIIFFLLPAEAMISCLLIGLQLPKSCRLSTLCIGTVIVLSIYLVLQYVFLVSSVLVSVYFWSWICFCIWSIRFLIYWLGLHHLLLLRFFFFSCWIHWDSVIIYNGINISKRWSILY